MRKAAFVAILAVLVVVVPLAFAEIALRVIGLGEPILYEVNASYRFAPKPDQRVQRRRGSMVTIDGRGLRGSVPWETDAARHVLFVGDSVTWGGTNVDDTLTFADLVCKNLAARTGQTHVCGNAGVNGYGADNMTQRIRYGGYDDADAIVAVLISGDAIRGLTPIESGPQMIQPAPRLIGGLWEAAIQLGYQGMRFLRGQAERDDRDDLPVARESIARLADTLRAEQAKGKTVMFVLSPDRRQLGGVETPLTETVRRSMAQSGLPFLDLHETMTEARGSLDPAEPLYVDNVHLDYAGHRIYAAKIADALAAALGAGP